jgi:hypothetical protein
VTIFRGHRIVGGVVDVFDEKLLTAKGAKKGLKGREEGKAVIEVGHRVVPGAKSVILQENLKTQRTAGGQRTRRKAFGRKGRKKGREGREGSFRSLGSG